MSTRGIEIYCLFISILTVGCDDREDWEQLKTLSPANGVYIERFYKSFGVYGGSCEKYYVTDSSTYRFHVGNSDDNSYLLFNVVGSTLYVKKYSDFGTGFLCIQEDTFELEK